MVPKNLFAGQQWRNRHREQSYGLGERGGEGQMYGESNMQTCMLPCVKQILRELKPGLCNNLEGWGGKRGLRDIQEGGDIGVPYG